MSNESRSDEQWLKHAEDKLWEMIEGAEVTQEKLDKDGCVHELRSKLPPSVDAIKFALKNRSKGKWADKTEVTNTQINVNLTASYNEVKEIMARKKAKIQEQQHLQSLPIIEGEIVNESETNGDTI